LTFLEVQIASHPFNYLQQRLLSRDTLPTQWTKMLETFKNVLASAGEERTRQRF